MSHTIYQLADVFKQTGFPEYTYAVREEYDVIFRNSLLDGGTLIYLYGDSKSGKTSMWKKYIGNDGCLEIKITERMTIQDFYADLMCKVEPFIETQFETIDGDESAVSIGGEGGLKNILSASGEAENKTSSVKTIKYERVANPGLSLTTVTDAVSKIDKTIILEDFQVASDDFVKGISSILKAFADNTIRVIIVGIDNKVPVLVKEREDIAGRITTINLSHFKKNDLKSIIQQGEDRLNVEFSEEVIGFLVEESLERAYILQGLCRLICSLKNITETCKNKQIINDLEDARRACKLFAFSHQAVYEPTARDIAQAATKKNKHDTYRWLLIWN